MILVLLNGFGNVEDHVLVIEHLESIRRTSGKKYLWEIFLIHWEDWMLYRGRVFLAVEWYGSSPTPSPPFRVSKVDRAIHSKTEKERHLAEGRGGKGGRGVGEEPNHTTARNLGHLSWSFNTPCSCTVHMSMEILKDTVQSHIWEKVSWIFVEYEEVVSQKWLGTCALAKLPLFLVSNFL